MKAVIKTAAMIYNLQFLNPLSIHISYMLLLVCIWRKIKKYKIGMYLLNKNVYLNPTYCIVGSLARIMFGKFTRFEHLAKKSLVNE